jgi:hypothetical protein
VGFLRLEERPSCRLESRDAFNAPHPDRLST